jgi:hypothetical protein
MKKNLLWMLAAILTCGAMFTSCTNGLDNPVYPAPDPGPDEASMFIQNVLNDNRYQLVYSDALEGNYIRLDVDSYEEAMAEFLKLLPEGVAATAYEYIWEKPNNLAEETTGFSLNAPLNNDKDSIFICQTRKGLEQALGYAYASFTPDIIEALGVTMIVYMPSEKDDLNFVINALMELLPYCKPDPEDMGNLICTAPSPDEAQIMALSFFNQKMVTVVTRDENGNAVVPLSDSQGNSYGHITNTAAKNLPEGIYGIVIFDDELRANMEKVLQVGFSKVTFIVAPAEETPAEQ